MGVTVLTLDGNDLAADVGLIVNSNISGFRDQANFAHRFGRVPDKIAQQLLTVQVQADPRALVVRGILEAADLATLNANRDILKYRLNKAGLNSPLLVSFADLSGRHFRAYPDGGMTVETIHPAMLQATEEVTIPLICYDPRQYVTIPQVIGPFTADTAHPLGTSPVGASFSVAGTTFTLTYKNFGGTVLQTFTVTSASGTQPIIVDMEKQTVLDSLGVKQDQFITGGDFFVLDPNDGDFEASNWPTVGCGVSCTSTYNEAYL